VADYLAPELGMKWVLELLIMITEAKLLNVSFQCVKTKKRTFALFS